MCIHGWQGSLRMNRIDCLLEKFLTGFKESGHTVEIFVNPTKKELAEISDNGNFRFIADAKNKKVYAFPVNQYHRRTWDNVLKRELSDHRSIYKDPTLFAGAKEGSSVRNWGWGDNFYSTNVIEEWLTHPDMFDFAKKFGIDIGQWMEDYKEDMQWKVDND